VLSQRSPPGLPCDCEIWIALEHGPDQRYALKWRTFCEDHRLGKALVILSQVRGLGRIERAPLRVVSSALPVRAPNEPNAGNQPRDTRRSYPCWFHSSLAPLATSTKTRFARRSASNGVRRRSTQDALRTQFR
jgi:hypothetical protein